VSGRHPIPVTAPDCPETSQRYQSGLYVSARSGNHGITDETGSTHIHLAHHESVPRRSSVAAVLWGAQSHQPRAIRALKFSIEAWSLGWWDCFIVRISRVLSRGRGHGVGHNLAGASYARCIDQRRGSARVALLRLARPSPGEGLSAKPTRSKNR
jgi:hypothetical protein